MNTTTMGGKPVYEIPVKSVINFDSGFAPKLLCDGPTFSLGTTCVYTCAFCYVPAVMAKSPQVSESGPEHHFDKVVRRKDGLTIMAKQLQSKSKKLLADPYEEGRVIYASPLVDVAANVELAKETVEACKIILAMTPWHIRLLSKSNLLPLIAKLVGPEGRGRIIYGVSTGTLNDKLAAAFEEGTALVSKRIASLHRLQDDGQRTFGMICPSLPQRDYNAFGEEAAAAIRADQCEHVWAEVINVRGESLTRTCTALRAAGFAWEGAMLEAVSMNPIGWEDYSRETFAAHARIFSSVPALHGKLRFLQYVNPRNIDWWKGRVEDGAVLLGKAAHG